MMLNVQGISKIYKKGKGGKSSFNALDDVSFQANAGEVIGILGRNGSGKSTLLKIISGLVTPTYGMVTHQGKVSSLLEIGGGIHPELNGKENYYLKGRLLGISKSDLDDQYDQLLSFTELDDFIEEPVKNYSNGMYMRLALGIGLTAKADIYLFDEVLSVGDLAFQRKCFTTIQNLAASGALILVVSHNLNELEQYCNRYVWLDRGGIVEDRKNSDILKTYVADLCPPFEINSKEINCSNFNLTLKSLSLTNGRDVSIPIMNLDPINIEVRILSTEVLPSLNVTLVIEDLNGVPLFSLSTFNDKNFSLPSQQKDLKFYTTIKKGFLNSGHYITSVFIYVEGELYKFKNLKSLTVMQSKNDDFSESYKGFIREEFLWQIR